MKNNWKIQSVTEQVKALQAVGIKMADRISDISKLLK